LLQIIDKIESTKVSSQVLIKLLVKKPGIKDNNVQVQKLRLECLKKIIEKFSINRYLVIVECLKSFSLVISNYVDGVLIYH